MKNNTRLLIVGGGGFIGRNLIGKLKNSYTITSVSRTSKIASIKNINLDLMKSDFDFLKEQYK